MASANYFETITKSFVDVPIQGGIDTLQFLEATEGLIGIFDLLGNSAFSIVQNDMNGNVTKIRNRYLAAPDKSQTLEALVANEKTEKKQTGTEGLLWLTRGLKFTQIALVNSQGSKSEELSASFSKAYEVTLKQYHSFVVKPIFALAMKACPYRAAFYAKLGSPLEKVEEALEGWLAALGVIIAQIEAYYKLNVK